MDDVSVVEQNYCKLFQKSVDSDNLPVTPPEDTFPLSVYPHDIDGWLCIEKTLARADECLYSATDMGRNRVVAETLTGGAEFACEWFLQAFW